MRKTTKTTMTRTSNPATKMKTTNAQVQDWGLARRDLLKGLGVGLGCLPLLSAGTARAQAGRKTFFCVLTSEGYRQGDWAPKTGPLAGQTLPYATAPLEAHKADIIVLPDLGNPAYGGPNTGGGHGSYGSIFWGGDPQGRVSYKQPQGKTLDQVVAFGLPATSRKSLPLAVQLNRAPQSSPEAGSNRCFWLAKGQPINPILDPYATYMEVFAGAQVGGGANGGADDPAVKRLMNQRKSMLDYVGRNLEAFKSRLGGEDKMSIEAHHQSVRDLELQLQGSGSGGGAAANCGGEKTAMIDLNDALKYPDILKAHMSLGVQALKCGVTNVATLQLSDSSGNNINFAFVPGIPDAGTGYKTKFRNYHDVGHNPVLGGVDHKRIVDKWMMEQFAVLIGMMKAVPQDGGTMLDNGLILWGNHMQDGSNHVAGKIPWLLAGKAGGYFNTGQCPPSTGKPLNGVMADVCAAFGVAPAAHYGNPWPGLKRV
jgi:hypothetical protein